MGAGGEAVTRVAGVTALWPVVIGLEKHKRTGYEVFFVLHQITCVLCLEILLLEQHKMVH